MKCHAKTWSFQGADIVECALKTGHTVRHATGWPVSFFDDSQVVTDEQEEALLAKWKAEHERINPHRS